MTDYKDDNLWLMQGDCLERMKEIPSGSIDMVLTDPPYGTTLVEFDKVRRGSVHPTQKPVALMEYLIKTYTNEQDVVLDFTAGSGTTGVACVNLNRKFIGIEKDENYFNIAQQRINDTILKEEL